MVVIKSDLVLLLIFFHVSHCQRRIVDGEVVSSDKPYVVYLVKATLSAKRYDAWLCGGALISVEFIITSAACVEDVNYLYAIAGYRKYVSDKYIENDDCTKQMKKKVVYTCVPVSYQFSYDELEKWSYIDIALVKVESPYDLNDARFQIMCSYIPTIIPINYDPKRQATDVDAMVLGWGHKEFWRKRDDKNNYNQEILHFASTSLMDKEACKVEYAFYPELVKTIDKFMICSLEPGHLNDKGEPTLKNPPLVDGCVTQQQKLKGLQGIPCEVEVVLQDVAPDEIDHPGDETRKHMSLNERSDDVTNYDVNGTSLVNGTDFVNKSSFVNRIGYVNRIGSTNRTYTISRRSGICQNDHGGPLVTWVGSREVLIGIASVFKISDDNECVGPFLYTSTMCNGAFLHCVLSEQSKNANEKGDRSRDALCDSPPSVKGFDTIERYVSWKDHPAGPADNEINNLRDRKKGKDRFATKLKSAESEEVNPLRDRNAQKVSFPKFPPREDHLSDKRAAKDRFSKIGPPSRIGRPPKIRPPPNLGPPHNLGPPRNLGPPNLIPPPNLGPLNLMPPPNLGPPRNLGLPPNLGPPTNLKPPPKIRRPVYGENPFKNVPSVMNMENKQTTENINQVTTGHEEVKMRPQRPLHTQ